MRKPLSLAFANSLLRSFFALLSQCGFAHEFGCAKYPNKNEPLPKCKHSALAHFVRCSALLLNHNTMLPMFLELDVDLDHVIDPVFDEVGEDHVGLVAGRKRIAGPR